MVDIAIQAIAPEMDAILSAYSEAHEVVKTWDSICDLVMKYPGVLWWKRCAAPTTMGAHPANRGNIGFMMSEALVNAHGHVEVGWSLRKANQGAWAVECPADTQLTREWKKWNDEQSNKQALPPHDTLVGCTFGASHITAFLRGALCAYPSTSSLLAPSGKMCKHSLSEKHESLGKALMQGLEYNFLCQKVVQKWPIIIQVGWSALNHRGTQSVSEIEGLMTMSSQFQSAISAGMSEDDSWDLAERVALRSDPFWKPWSPSLKKLCRVLSYEQLEYLRDAKAMMVKVHACVTQTCVHNMGASIFQPTKTFH